jgi:hypothetical protein
MKKYPSDLQKMYYTLLVLWLISFSEKSVAFFTDPSVRFFFNSDYVLIVSYVIVEISWI